MWTQKSLDRQGKKKKIQTVVKCSSPSNRGISLQTNSVGLPSSSPSCIPTILILCFLDRASWSRTLARSWLFCLDSSEYLVSNFCILASKSLVDNSWLATRACSSAWEVTSFWKFSSKASKQVFTPCKIYSDISLHISQHITRAVSGIFSALSGELSALALAPVIWSSAL